MQDVLKRRLSQAKERIEQKTVKEQIYKITMFLIEDMLRECNEHLDYIKSASGIVQEDKETILAKFNEVKIDLMECQNNYNFKVQQAKIEHLSRSLSIKSEKCRGLEAKLSFLEEQLSEKHNNRQDIFLSVPLIIEAHVTGHPDNVCCFPFDKGYTCYEQLHKKIQEKFGLERFSIVIREESRDDRCGKQWTEEDYKNAIETVYNEQTSDASFHVISIDVIDIMEEPDYSDTLEAIRLSIGVDTEEAKSLAEQSKGTSHGFSDLGDLDFPLTTIDREVRLQEQKKENHSSYFTTGPPPTSISLDWEGESEGMNNLTCYLNRKDTDISRYADAEFVLIMSNPKNPTQHHCGRKLFYQFGSGYYKGYEPFFPPYYSYANDKGENRFIENGQCVISAYLRVVQDPSDLT
ncbi:hypothetical protein EC973_006133 [Apophysomyces ossiformis]|uniref:Uncharacterized protein n=1 Tax=Apophysomyces ossiformis TaxID=679940 RepID=A0A8H7ER90_9FUNG|nr:hypothetical protein EC973_006133 [Apophysomyces ossiformis]